MTNALNDRCYFLSFCCSLLSPEDNATHIHRVLRMVLDTINVTYREYHNLNGWTIDYPTVYRFISLELANSLPTE